MRASCISPGDPRVLVLDMVPMRRPDAVMGPLPEHAGPFQLAASASRGRFRELLLARARPWPGLRATLRQDPGAAGFTMAQ
jgi:hypothetical protein